MVIECMITDQGRVSFDCVKKTMTKGMKLEIPDVLYTHAEIQGALRNNIIRIVGDAPVAVMSAAQAMQYRKMRNAGQTKLAFECLKRSVDPNCVINIPENVMYEPEIQNAIGYGLLVDENAPAPVEQIEATPAELFAAAQTATKPATLEEVKVQDGPSQAPKTASSRRQPGRPRKPFKAKPVSALHSGVEDGTASDGDLSKDELYRETPVWEDKDARGPVAAQKPGRTRTVDEDPMAEAGGLPKLRPGVKPKTVDPHTIDEILGGTEDSGGF